MYQIKNIYIKICNKYIGKEKKKDRIGEEGEEKRILEREIRLS